MLLFLKLLATIDYSQKMKTQEQLRLTQEIIYFFYIIQN